MNRLFELGDRYAKDSNWMDFALVKFCLCAMGILIGLQIPKSRKETVEVAAAGIFLGTYIPLMVKVIRIIKEMLDE